MMNMLWEYLLHGCKVLEALLLFFVCKIDVLLLVCCPLSFSSLIVWCGGVHFAALCSESMGGWGWGGGDLWEQTPSLITVWIRREGFYHSFQKCKGQEKWVAKCIALSETNCLKIKSMHLPFQDPRRKTGATQVKEGNTWDWWTSRGGNTNSCWTTSTTTGSWLPRHECTVFQGIW